MFIGHFGVALAAKKYAPRTSLGTLFFATEFLDLLWPTLLLLGVEHVRVTPGITRMQPFDFYDYPISHSLLTGVGWAVLVGVAYFGLRRYAAGAWTVGALVVSHWVLDFLVHRPDLPLWPGGPKVGLGLWNSWVGGMTLEVLVFAAGVYMYVTRTRARDTVGRYAFWALMAFVFAGWLGGVFGTPPSDQKLIGAAALSLWIVVPWAWWADAHRELLSR
jgi:hypothetical protein